MSFGLHQALNEVRELKRHILTKQRFKGYSGRARALGGCAALAAALVLRAGYYPADLPNLLVTWGAVLAVGLTLNYGALVYWFLYNEEVARDWRSLMPALEVLPAFFVGGMLTLGLLQQGHAALLPGVWLSLYGLANLASRHVLPRNICWGGAWYMAAGGVCLIWPAWAWGQPLVLGGAFFIGEWLGGLALHYDQAEGRTFWSFLGLPEPASAES